MTRFTDGPAAGKTLQLGRAPLFLRVVRKPDGTIDALDQLDDAPEKDEEVFVYRKVPDDGTVHLCGTRNGKRWGGTYACATYRLNDQQPDDATARSKTAWPLWCEARFEEMRGSPSPAKGGK